MTKNTNKDKPKRPYRLITPEEIASFHSATVITGNGSSAVDMINPDYKNRGDRAYRIRRKSEDESIGEYIENGLQQIGADAVQVIGELVNSSDEKIATKNAHYVVDHLRGKAIQRSETKSLNLSIEAVLD